MAKPLTVDQRLLAAALGRSIQAKRLEAGLSMAELSRALGYKTTAAVTAWESGKVMPTERTLKRIAGIVGCEYNELLAECEEPPAKRTDALGENIRKRREELGLSRGEVALAMGVGMPGLTRTHMKKWEEGNVIPSTEKLMLLANALDSTIDSLLFGKPSEEDKERYAEAAKAAANQVTDEEKERRKARKEQALQVGRNIRWWRLKKGMDQAELGFWLRLSPEQANVRISSWENGVNFPAKSTLIYLAIFLGCKVTDLLEGAVSQEDIDELMSGVRAERLHYVATDLYTHHFRDTVDTMDDATFEVYLRYHFTICERNDMVGLTNHSLDVFRKMDEQQ